MAIANSATAKVFNIVSSSTRLCSEKRAAKDSGGLISLAQRTLAYIYFKDETGRRSATKSLEARRITANVAKLPELSAAKCAT